MTNIEKILTAICIILLIALGVLIYGVNRMKHNFDSDHANVYFTDENGIKLENNPEPARFTIVQSYTYNLNHGYAVVRIAVIRDKQTGDEYMITRDPDAGLVVTRIPATGR